MPKLINPQTNTLEEVPQDQFGNAFLSGKFNLPAGQKVNLNDASGNPVSVDAAEVHEAVTKGGFTFPTSAQIKESELQAKYGEGIGNELKAAAAAFARGASLGLTDQALTKTGLVEPETLKQLKERNPVASGVGEIAGVVAPMLIPGGAALNPIKAVTNLGKATELATAGKLAVEGGGIANKILTSVGSKAAGSFIEGTAYGLGKSVSEQGLGDPDLTAEKVASNIGFSALLAGGIGGLIGVPAAFLGKEAKKGAELVANKEARTAVQAIKGEMDTVAGRESANPAAVETVMDQMNIPEEKKMGLLQGFRLLKKNVKEIDEAASRLGVPAFAGMRSADPKAQMMQSMIWQSPSLATAKARQELTESVGKVLNVVESPLKTGTTMSGAEMGSVLKEGITKKFSSELEPVQALYQTIKKDTATIPLNANSMKRIGKNIMELEGIGLSPSSPQYQLAKSVAEELPNLKTVEDIQTYRKILRDRTAGVPGLKFTAGQIQEKLTNLEEAAIIRHAKNMIVPGTEAGAAVDDLISQIGQAKSKYRVLREKMGELGDVIGKKKIYGPQDFLDHIENMTPESLAKKIFNKNNSEFFEFFSKEFPEETKLLIAHEKGKIFDKAFKTGKFSPKVAIKEIESLPKEIKNSIFTSGELQNISDAKLWLAELGEKAWGPSGTPAGLAMTEYLGNPFKAAWAEGADIAKLTALETLIKKTGGPDSEKIKILIRLERAAQKTARNIETGTKALFRVVEDTTPAVSSAITDKRSAKTETKEEREKEFARRTDSISKYADSPEVLLDKLQKDTDSLYPNAPGVTGALQMNTVRGLQFLNSKIPQREIKPLSSKPVPSAAEISKFNRYYDAVENPLSVLKLMKQGTLTPESVETISVVYPRIYSEIQSSILNQLTTQKKRVPYKTRFMLSMFLGQDLDESTTPRAIQANQKALTAAPENTPQNPTPNKGADSLNISERTMTPLDKAAAR